MNGRALIILVVAVLIAGGAVLLVKSHTVAATNGPKVLVASTTIAAGTFLRADKQLSWVEWPRGDNLSAFITNNGHKLEEFNGAVARRTILAGEPISMVSIVRANEGGFMSAVLTQGKRAVSIAVNSTSGNAGFIFPGDHVDLILTHRIPNATGPGDVLASETFIQDLRVLAIDQMLDNPENKAVIAKTITLEVSPKQAEMINVAANLGSISVSLRSLASDKARAIVPAIEAPENDNNYSTNSDVSKLMGSKSDVGAKVSVYHGSSNEQLNFH